MAIENIAGMNKLLTSYNTEDWMKSASIDQAAAQFNELAATGIGAPPKVLVTCFANIFNGCK